MPAMSRMLSLAAAGAGVQHAAAVTPVEKVLSLLHDLQGQIEEQGKKEAAQYDKYSCFCKEQADEKLYMIEKSTKKIEELDAQISSLDADITALNGEIKELGTEIDTLSTDIADAQKTRDEQHADYKVADKDMVDAIAAVEGAIEALKASKDDMSEGVKLDFAQLRKVANQVLAVASSSPKLSIAQDKLSTVAALAQQSPPAYEYRSNDIIATLEDLKDTFNKKKKEQDLEEFNLNSEWEKKDLNLKNQKKFAEEAKDQKEKIVAKKTETKETAEADHKAETGDKTADEAFMKVLTEECQNKAQMWDQRSSTRSNELTAIADAISVLKEKVGTSWSANKKLAQLQVPKADAPQGHWEWVEEKPAVKKAPSFLQLRGSQNQALSAQAIIDKATQVLTKASKKLGSSVLLAAAVRVDASKDHFVKVREIIKDLVARLEADAEAEATHKSFCDKAMAENVQNRDDAKAEVEGLTSEKSQLNAEEAKLAKEIAQLAKDIAALNKALKEATELRSNEKAENEATVDTAKEGKAGVELALKLLSEFYSGAAGGSFVQYVPPNSDRSGKTVGDLAPEVFTDEYKGSQSESKGIIGILEVILSDFERTIQTVTDEETAAQEEFDLFKEATETDISDKNESKKTKEGRVSEIHDELVENANSLKDEGEKLTTSEKALAELKKQCIDGEETYEERVAKRQKEIEALKEAHAILENWQS
eukprot:TRINITY_DN1905_c0_g1_i1.p2 TRINITY_DN1905_c0_g1~~TRINITY_DN1905_c0_g1_i1.p2  ORF type:complete len:708 (-),score=332.22 TRINITY_DN1905_c0_g1_i1:78-2201(-)